MQKLRILCLVLVSLLALSPAGAVFAQEEEEPEYALIMTPADGVYSTVMIAGREKDIRVDLENIGDEAVTKISINSELPEGWTVTFPDREPIPIRLVAVEGDSIILDVGPYESALREGVMVSTRSVVRLKDGNLSGTFVARYETTEPDSVLRGRQRGTRSQ